MQQKISNNSVIKPKWKKIKLSGSFTDDGASLEGLLGLEVLENFDGIISKRSIKNIPKKEKQRHKKSINKREKNIEPGRFVRPLPAIFDDLNVGANINVFT